MANSKKICLDYFGQHIEAKDEVIKAYYAYHAPHFRLDESAHNFTNGSREAKCLWCGRSREDVRWDNLPYNCLKRPELNDPQVVLKEEEENYLKLLGKAEQEIPKLIKRINGDDTLDGRTLSILHHTYGYEPEVVAGVIDFPNEMLLEYHKEMEIERERSRARQEKKIITVSI